MISSTITPAMARRIELWPADRLVPYAKNARTHSPEQVAQIAASIAEFGFNAPILVDSDAGIIAGHGRLLAAHKLGLAEVPVVVLDHLSENQRRAYIIADNRLSELAGWDNKLLAEELRDLEHDGLDLALVGFSEEELEGLLAGVDEPVQTQDVPEDIPEAPATPVTRSGDVWQIGKHRLICGDCRDAATVQKLVSGARAQLCITSPPYAAQREYDKSSGFKPILPDEYAGWYKDVAANVAAILAPDGSYFLNIKEHAEGGERSLYVKDLVLAHRREWGWRFVDEFCWRNTANGVPGKWSNRFKNAWEPVFHFSRRKEIKFRPTAAGHESEDVVVYAPGNPSAPSGSGLLGCGAEKTKGIAWPSNVIEAKSEGGQGKHSAPFPRALPEFFLRAFSDIGDLVFDPFMGSGTTMAAADALDRAGYGCEISPAYCDVILRRIMNLTGETAVLLETGETFEAAAEARGVVLEQAE